MVYIYFSSCLVILLASLPHVTAARKNSLRGTRWWTLAQDYELPKSRQEHNNDGPVMMNDYSPVNELSPRTQILTKKQRKLVERNPGSIFAVAQGALQAIKECQHQFQNRRWNCPTKDSNIGGSMFGKILGIGCRETAFIYSITAAGVAHAMARACSEGKIHTCSCDYRLKQPTGKDWKWGGCSDNFKFGYRFSKHFIDSIEQGEDLRYMVNKQNNEAGRRHVVSETTQQCKCHGMSGSCAMKTCWMRLPTFRKVGNLLKERFDGASKVYAENRVKKSKRNRFNFIPVDDSHKSPTRKDMVYYEDSPDFCTSSSELKFTFGGTAGRECNATSRGIDGCRLMCCDRGYKTETYIAKTRCSCTFKWCCDVECKVCEEQKTRHICN